ncbi:hypothetical protein [Pseudaminobacter sp. NGMCC 1.201702]|uniref:hypothetical protein n=1 Tax=Pseudaminobacter sp. NGMCC 1.201702 TaxID=3391825 RepID=UPI0039EF442E
MPLQNRVDPFGDIHAVTARGMFTGNRGVIHDPMTRSLLKRRWTTKAWIICLCEFRRRRREVMGRNSPSGRAGWTELFFLDEVTALAAGHRPCFYCRREEAKAYAACFGDAFGIAKPRAPAIDAMLHGQRRAAGGRYVVIDERQLNGLPDGAMVAMDGKAHTKRGGTLLAWSFEGYEPAQMMGRERLELVTPLATVEVLRAGYRPVWHASAET